MTITVSFLAVLAAASLAVWLYGLAGIYRSLAAMDEWPACARRHRGVSAVIAARNEEKRLPVLLERLMEADERLLEVIVVDDGSSDATPRVVEEYSRRDPRIRLIRSPGAPAGWAPKAYALSLGAQQARGDVLLFLDADTRPGSGESLVAAAAELAEPGSIAAFVPRFICRGFTCKAVEAYMTAVANGFYGFHRVRSRGDSLAWMYGCCWAISRDYYVSLGGHAVVRDSLVEDRDFASHAKRVGAEIRPVDARSEVGVESYEDLRGYAMLIARLAADRAARTGPARWAGYVAAAALLHLSPSLATAAGLLAGHGLAAWLGMAALVAQTVFYAAGSRVNLQHPAYGAVGHLGSAAAIWGLLLARRSYEWRGRRYRAEAPGSRTSAA